jgi:hypothetical protein
LKTGARNITSGCSAVLEASALHFISPRSLLSAHKIIELAKTGERNPDVVCARALNGIRGVGLTRSNALCLLLNALF